MLQKNAKNADFITEITRVMMDRSPVRICVFVQSPWEDYPKTPTDICLDCLGWLEIATVL